ncbi:MAG TPA: hypothetical protein DIT07_15460 [Sphingobacteriaceae bacterium]|nr:hypothetical protein [Sphingobacteriaceae bacterium]
MKKLNFSELAQELEVISQEETKKIKGGYWSLMGEEIEVNYYNPIIYWPIEGYTYYSSGGGGYYDGGGGGGSSYYDNYEYVDPFRPIAPLIARSSFVGYNYNGETNCFDLAKMQLAPLGLVPCDVNNRIQMALENNSHSISSTNSFTKGVDTINKSLSSGKPIIVGVDEKLGSTNSDEVTDHFFVIVGRGNDAGGDYFTYYDNRTSYVQYGASENNKLYIDYNTGLITGTFNKDSQSWDYTVSQVRPNK